jgi:RNA polymerase sigma-70 factor (ECF subfamily)
MADIVRKKVVSVEGPSLRERLQAMDDSAVVTAFLGGEERAFSELVTRYQTRLLNFVYRTIGDREKAEDLVQEVFIRVYRHLHRFDRSKKFSTWVYTIASNLAKNELRNRSRNPLVLFQTVQKNFQDDDRPLQFEDTTSRPDDMYRKRHLREIVEETVAKLPEHHRNGFHSARARRQVLRGDRGDHGLQSRDGQVPPEQSEKFVRGNHRPVRRLGPTVREQAPH